jgi:hypothetical protein
VFLLGRTKRPVANCPACPSGDTGHDLEACPCLTCHGFYAATLDPQRIHAMTRAVPGGMLAIRTGTASGLVVIDIDPDHGGHVHPDLMPRTAYVITGSGGAHLYYRHPGTPILNSQSRVAPGIDVRGDGGYVVAPPSIHPRTRRPYRWGTVGEPVEMPPALLAACRPGPAVAAHTGPTTTGPGAGISTPDALLTAIVGAVARAPEGRRRTTLYGSARGVARMVAADALSRADAWTVLTAAGRAAGQSDREIRTAIAGGFNAEGVAA